MASLRYDVARAFIQGKSASNSTKSFRSEAAPDGTAAIFTYGVCLATRTKEGNVELCKAAYQNGQLAIDRRYSITSTIHQHALKVVLDHPNFGDWRK